jgi:hypothetical protein
MISSRLNHWIELFHTTARNLIATPMITALDDSSNVIQTNEISTGKRPPRGRANW